MIIHNIEIKQLIDEFNSITDHAEFLTYFSRNKDLQLAEIKILDKKSNELRRLNESNKHKFTEQELNLVLCFELTLITLKSELLMIIHLKDEKMNQAWNNLINAQYTIHNVIGNHPLLQKNHFDGYLQKLLDYERLLFPKMNFVSTGSIIRKSRCNICGSDYEECDHIKGKMYQGELCLREIYEADLEEVSLVETPANKRCRQLDLVYEGKIVDFVTLNESEEPKDSIRFFGGATVNDKSSDLNINGGKQ